MDSSKDKKTLLVIGPHPPPIGGATTTVQLFLDETAKYEWLRTISINTSPPDYRKKTALLKLETIQRTAFILTNAIKNISRCDAVLLFATNQFIFTLGLLLLLLARWRHKPFYLKPFGGDLDLYLMAQKKIVRVYMLSILRAMDSVMLQTQQLQTALMKLGCSNTSYVPGYRPLSEIAQIQKKDNKPNHLRLIYLSHIKREKGPFILLEALHNLREDGYLQVICDFYGPIFAEDQADFFKQLELIPGAQYGGVVEMKAVSHLIATYHALVFPTYFISEGHPGVIIEAMQAGVPVISTQHRAIPELITHNQNGLLVPIKNSQALSNAIKQLGMETSLRKKMGQRNYQKAKKFQVSHVVPTMLNLIFSN